ncbi:DMT family transporter [Thermococcus waiotapuensis]|uniref:DMT family transporter n=1 Tax=Thermococcus waiotapuensis TaxID=90909 RepID=A0AAE4NTP3_9EURY|nr:DMT family transporter [Thermococcus waiotapuensis]MDV3104128.1 DMT family transporter [Thermococcus waiotapuensis]
MNGRVKIAASMLIWGSVGVFARFSTLDGLSLAFMRVLMGSAIFLVGYSLKERGWLGKAFSSVRPKLGLVFLLGLALALNWAFFFSAVMHTTIAKATLIYYLAPIIVVLLAGIFLGEDIKGRLPYVGMAFLGALMIGLQEKPSPSSGDFIGILFALAGAFFYALVTLLGRYLRDVESAALTFFQLLFATLLLAPLVALRGLSLTPRTLGVVGIIALVHTFLALLLYMEGLKEVEAGEAALLSYLDPMSAVIYAFLIFGEVPGVTTAIGGALILLASALDIMGKG